MTVGEAGFDPIDLWMLGAFVIGSSVAFVFVRYSPWAELERVERDYGLGWLSLWLAFVAGLAIVLLTIRAGLETSGGSRAVVAGGALLLGHGLFHLVRAAAAIGPGKRLEDVERTPIEELSAPRDGDGSNEDATAGRLVSVSGEAVATDGTVETTFTGTDALVAESTVSLPKDDATWDPDSEPPDQIDWNASHLFTDHVPFAVDDGTGCVRVDPDGANFELERRASFEVAGDERPPERIESLFMATQDLNDTTRRRLYEEDALVPGDRVSVVGRLEDGVITGGSDRERFFRSLPFVVGTGSLPSLRDRYRYRIARGVLGALEAAGGVALLYYGVGAL